MTIYNYENYKIVICYSIYNEVTGKQEYRESPVEETKLNHYSYVMESTFEKIKQSICVADSTTVPKDAKLCFDGSSKFPRYKLEQTGYKRKLKPETADYIIVNTDVTGSYSHHRVYTNNVDTLYLCYDNCTIGHSDVTLLDTTLVSMSQQMKSFLDLHKTNYKYLSDDQLNQLCDSCAADLTLTNLEQIMSLVFNPDKENIELGLKVFAATNVSKYPMTARFLLSCTDLRKINKNITIKNLITQADIKSNLVKERWGHSIYYWSVEHFYDKSNIPTASSKDREFALRVVHRYMKKYNMSISEASRLSWFVKEYYNE